MPLVPASRYRAPFLCRNGHAQTIVPSLLRTIDGCRYTRERIDTPDGDFLDLDWARTGSRRIAVLSHGLEGNSSRPYVKGMARMLNLHGWDALAWNYRGCSGETNRKLRMYHNGAIDDLDCVIRYLLQQQTYGTVALIGFSLGGNLSLVYLGANSSALDPRIGKAVVFSVPCDLAASAHELSRLRNRLYMQQFLISLHGKIKTKMKVMPGLISDEGYGRIKNFKDFDDRYTAPLHGFRDAEDYWCKCSSGQYIPAIRVPTLIVNALDDPFLTGRCYPVQEASDSAYVHLEMPEWGGHVGFMQFNHDGSYWSEKRAIEFLEQA